MFTSLWNNGVIDEPELILSAFSAHAISFFYILNYKKDMRFKIIRAINHNISCISFQLRRNQWTGTKHFSAHERSFFISYKLNNIHTSNVYAYRIPNLILALLISPSGHTHLITEKNKIHSQTTLMYFFNDIYCKIRNFEILPPSPPPDVRISNIRPDI